MAHEIELCKSFLSALLWHRCWSCNFYEKRANASNHDFLFFPLWELVVKYSRKYNTRNMNDEKFHLGKKITVFRLCIRYAVG